MLVDASRERAVVPRNPQRLSDRAIPFRPDERNPVLGEGFTQGGGKDISFHVVRECFQQEDLAVGVTDPDGEFPVAPANRAVDFSYREQISVKGDFHLAYQTDY